MTNQNREDDPVLTLLAVIRRQLDDVITMIETEKEGKDGVRERD